MKYPWMMYRKGPGLDLPRGERVSCQPANDETEYAAAIAAGWFPSVPEALADIPIAKPEPRPAVTSATVAPPVERSAEREVVEVPSRGPGRPRKS